MRCDSCGHEFIGNYGDACPQCGHATQNPFTGSGQQPSQGPASTGASGPSPWQSPQAGGGAGPTHDGAGIPWENEQSANSLFATIKSVLFDASDTFSGAQSNVGIGPAFIYATVLGVAGGAIGLLWQLLIGTGGASNLDQLGQLGEYGELMEAFAAPGIGQFIALPFQVVIGLFIGAGIIHLCLMMVGGNNEGFEATFRAVAFGQGSVAIFQAVPFIGPMIGGIWALVAYIIGLKEMHNITGGKAAAAVLIPIGLCCVCIFGGIIWAAVMIGAAAGS